MKNFKKVALVAIISGVFASNMAIGGEKWGKGGYEQGLSKYSQQEVQNVTINTPESDAISVSEITDNTTRLDKVEVSSLTYMREEEKLARDVYLTFANMYPNQKIFSNIATRSEQTHTDIMRDKLEQFNIVDPNPETNNLPYSIGVFTGKEWGHHFTVAYENFISLATEGELKALYLAALIEEEDIKEIVSCPEVMVEAGYPEVCALNYTDENALTNAYSSLLSGSKNHLRSYVRQIEKSIGSGNYEAQSLTQEEVDSVLGR